MIPFFTKDFVRDTISTIAVFASFTIVLVTLLSLSHSMKISKETLLRTKEALDTSRELWRKENRPLVVAYLRPSEIIRTLGQEGTISNCFDLVLGNYGKVPALDVKIKVVPLIPEEAILTVYPVPTKRSRYYSGEPRLKETIPIIVPGSESVVAIVRGTWVEEKLKKRTKYMAKCTYRDMLGQNFAEDPEIEIDFVPILPIITSSFLE
jgi:hypothetical protein